jgi:tetratricopeptide (TPR) repeat protein
MNRKQRRAGANLGSLATQLLTTAVRLNQAGQLVEAEARYRQAIAIKPDLAEAYSNLGIALAGQGKLDEAVTTYRRAIGIKPDYAEGYRNLGNILVRQGKLDEAIAAYWQVTGIKPDYAEAYRNLADSMKFKPGDPHLAAMEALAAQTDGLSKTRPHAARFRAVQGLCGPQGAPPLVRASAQGRGG